MPGGNAWGPVKSWTECEPVQCESECEKKQLELQAPRTSGLQQEGDFGVNGLPSGIARSREMKPEVGCEPSRASSGEESATFKNGVREVPPVESAWSQSAVNFVKQISPESQGSESSVCAAVRPHQLPRSHERASASSSAAVRLHQLQESHERASASSSAAVRLHQLQGSHERASASCAAVWPHQLPQGSHERASASSAAVRPHQLPRSHERASASGAAVRPHQLPRSHERASASCVSASCVSGCLQFACRMLGSPVQDNADHSDGISIRPAMKCLL